MEILNLVVFSKFFVLCLLDLFCPSNQDDHEDTVKRFFNVQNGNAKESKMSTAWTNYKYNWGILAIFWIVILMIVIIWLYCACVSPTIHAYRDYDQSKLTVPVLDPDLRFKLYVKNPEPTVAMPTIYLPFIRSNRNSLARRPSMLKTIPEALPSLIADEEPYEGGFTDPVRIKVTGNRHGRNFVVDEDVNDNFRHSTTKTWPELKNIIRSKSTDV